MVDDGEFLRALLVIVPINYLWRKIRLPWVFKKEMEVRFVMASLLTESYCVTNIQDVVGVLVGIVFFTFWIFQIQWTPPKLAYEL